MRTTPRFAYSCRRWSVFLLLVTVAAADEPAPSIEPADVPALLAVIRPASAELAYRNVEWETSLWRARVQAAAQDKPIVLWEMDGHPLGCT